ncbi:MAG: 16S rRNA (cytosine(1402)-N(4))-methyltransferase RsmH [Verrucomicrobia bacterium]|nr:16S rRNA (cytosine(1402)-N(4))-methyltransferase RsmH [Verrucomicrobiota bacterium]
MEPLYSTSEGAACEYHAPVLPQEVMSALAPGVGKQFVDCTLGGGGHSELLLSAGATVLGLDQDPEAVAYASARLAPFSRQFRAVRSSFGEVGKVLSQLGIAAVDGFLLDLGVSSHQLDTPARGFSFQSEGPLDMRMNPGGPVTAADLVNTASAGQLERMFKEYGEEPQAHRIAMRLVKDRMVRPFRTTLELAAAVESVSPRRGRTHPATKVFQALRIAVNRELEVLEKTLEELGGMLSPGGRLAVITFHSLEDRIVKQAFLKRSTQTVDRPEWSAPRLNPDCIFKKVTNKPLVASDLEQKQNPRSRSAKLRVVERLGALPGRSHG